MPTIISAQRPEKLTPEATTPQAKAHIGGNHVIGLKSSVTVDKLGVRISVDCITHSLIPDRALCQV
jgi:hypothetical protein